VSFEPKIVGFLCNWCSYAGADLAGISRKKYAPNVRIVRVMCSGRVDPTFVLKAFEVGADGVLICGCHPGECHYVEILYAAERLLELCQDEEITSPEVRTIPTTTPDEGAGVVEAPRGILFHHYQTDEKGIVQKVNPIVATVQNNPAMNMSIKKAARGLIKKGTEASEGPLNMVEMAFRAYDPCMACATRTFPGQMPLEVIIYNSRGEVAKRLSQH